MLALYLVRMNMYHGNTFDFISRSPATKLCLLSPNNSAVQSQKTFHCLLYNSRGLLLFGFSGQNCDRCSLPYYSSLDLLHHTVCVQAHLNVDYSGGQTLAALAQIFTIVGANASFEDSIFCNVELRHRQFIYLFIMIRQIASLHVADNTLYTDKNMQYYTIGWDMA